MELRKRLSFGIDDLLVVALNYLTSTVEGFGLDCHMRPDGRSSPKTFAPTQEIAIAATV